MALVRDLDRYPEAALTELVTNLRNDLAEVGELVRHPRGAVVDPASLVSAEELVEATLAVLDRPGPRDRAERAREANLAYAAMVTAIDLVKSHTEGPKVPQRRPSANP